MRAPHCAFVAQGEWRRFSEGPVLFRQLAETMPDTGRHRVLAQNLFAGVQTVRVDARMKLVLVAEQCGVHDDCRTAAARAGWEVTQELTYAQVPARLPELHADAAVMFSRQVSPAVLQAVRALNQACPLPVVLFTEDSLQQSIRDAVGAGVAAYVVDCRDVGRLGALLEVARARFTESQRLKKELLKVKTSLAERNTVEKAKGIIMHQRGISEEAAYRLLRKLAMDRNRRIGEVASDVIAAAEVLI
jgi:response regulator NasT